MPTLSYITPPYRVLFYRHPATVCYTTNHNNRDNLVSILYDLHIRALKTHVRMRVAISCDSLLQRVTHRIPIKLQLTVKSRLIC